MFSWNMAGALKAALLVVCMVSIAPFAEAHRNDESYVFFNVSDDALSGRVESTFDDLNKAIPLDTDGDGTITQDEVSAKLPELQAEISQHLGLTSAGTPVEITYDGLEFRELDWTTFAMFSFTTDLTATPEVIDMRFDFLFNDQDPAHATLAIIESNTRTGVTDNESQIALTFGAGRETQELSLIGRPWHEVFVDFVREGIHHIWIGYDHILFLLTFLLASVMVVRNGEFEPVDDFKAGLWNVAKLVTIFTIAHTITLSLAALGVMSLPIWFVEAVIAFSIIVVALDNIFPRFHKRAWLVIFIFGLFHGFGFANVLAPLGVEQNSKLSALFGFNIGVEIGQLAIVFVAFPILYLLRNSPLYKPVALKAGSVLIILMAAFWVFERTFDVFQDLGASIFGLIG